MWVDERGFSSLTTYNLLQRRIWTKNERKRNVKNTHNNEAIKLMWNRNNVCDNICATYPTYIYRITSQAMPAKCSQSPGERREREDFLRAGIYFMVVWNVLRILLILNSIQRCKTCKIGSRIETAYTILQMWQSKRITKSHSWQSSPYNILKSNLFSRKSSFQVCTWMWNVQQQNFQIVVRL